MFLVLNGYHYDSLKWIKSFKKEFRNVVELELKLPFSENLCTLPEIEEKITAVVIVAPSSGKTSRRININSQCIRVDVVINELDKIFGERIGCFVIRSSFALDLAHKTWLSSHASTIPKYVRVFGFYDKILSLNMVLEEKYFFHQLQEKSYQGAYEALVKKYQSWVSIHGFVFYDKDNAPSKTQNCSVTNTTFDTEEETSSDSEEFDNDTNSTK